MCGFKCAHCVCGALHLCVLGAADEQARVGSLRAQLGALEEEKAGEFKSRVKGLQDLSTALQAEQQSRLEAQLELNRQKKRVAGLEAEVQQQRAAMTQVRLGQPCGRVFICLWRTRQACVCEGKPASLLWTATL